MKKIVITFEDDGTVHIEAEGFAGKACLEATKPYEQDFGGVTKRTMKQEGNVQRTRTVER